jgi:predicted metal-dependent hydrolase
MLEYILKVSRKARRVRITIYPDSRVIVTRPYAIPDHLVENFIQQKSQWILKKLEKFKGVSTDFLRLRKSSKKEYAKHKKDALIFVTNKVIEFNKIYGYKYSKISIKNQKTRWGSCSKKGNLNFNYRIMFLPKKLADYIIVHELCHLEQLNHSKNFWNLVARAFPEYKEVRRELNEGKFSYL